ncbi:MAG: translation initiation factor [Patescibacteria group bacterium]|nr:translation initiation factor [Patescibacteria group bacterium]
MAVKTIEVEDNVTVGALADQLMIPATKLIAELFKNGIMATINERIDFDTAQIMVGELGMEVELVKKVVEEAPIKRPAAVVSDKAQSRPPVVAVMGHVDHGKTSLLDAIRGAEVAKGEAGGITQHISAYKVTHGDRSITLLDTPGHEAFAALREHGAQLTDLVIIVVAADDGIKPQTLEAIRFARKAGVKMVIAINKIDKEGADVNRIKQQLSENDLLIEEWGGDVITVEVSAKTKQNIDQLLDMVFLVSDVEELKADFDGPAHGLIIEAHMEQGRGPVAEALVTQGTLKPGDFVVAGAAYGKIRNLDGTNKQPITEATPSTPVVMSGFKELPEFGDEFIVVANEKDARAAVEVAKQNQKNNSSQQMSSGELLRVINRSNELQELNIIVKADVQGSLTSVIDSLKTLDTEEVAIRVVGSGVGAVNDNDAHLAHTSGAIIYGFNVSVPNNIKQIAARDKISIRLFHIIYELIDDAKDALSKMLRPEIVETELGRLIVKGVFNTTKTEVICGGEVTKGKLEVPALARVMRGNEVLAEVEVTNLKRGPQDAKEVVEGEMCGMNLKTTSRLLLEEGDKIELFRRETVMRQL